MKTIGEILAAKGKEVISIAAEALVLRAVETMVEKNVGALVVMDDDVIKGMITERDYLCKIVLKGRRSHDTRIKEIMSTDVIYADPADRIEDVMAVMTRKRIRHLPVMDKDRLCGIVSIGDVTKARAESQEVEIHFLKTYISDKYPG